MKCAFCGKELENGAEFCPECGMILSLGGVSEDNEEIAVEAEIPEYTPNVFRAMDFEEEVTEPAMELEVTDTEETAEVVEIIPEYTVDDKAEEEAVEEPAEAEAVEEELTAQEDQEEAFSVPEYDPNAAVSPEFVEELNKQQEEAESEPEDVSEETDADYEEPEYAPPEYEGSISQPIETAEDNEEPESAVEAVEEQVYEEASAEEVQQEAYPEYHIEETEDIPEEKPEDETLFAALFEDAEAEKIEDITPTADKPEKAPKKSFLSIALILVVLVGVIVAGGYVFKNVLPQIVDTGKSTTLAEEKVDGTTKGEKTTDKKQSTTKATTTKSDKETTTKETTDKESTTKETTTKEPTTKETTTKETTTKATTTKAPETTDNADEAVVKEPESYNVDEVPFFPTSGDISIKAGPSASSADMIIHPYGYPVYAYAKQGSFYYVHSPYLDFMGWVSAKDVTEYVEEGQKETYETEDEVTDAPSQESSVNYLAMINSAEGLNFRTGPGYDYGAEIVVPGGFYVRVSAVSEDNPGWVYVTVEDERYPYGTPGGWVLEDYLS